MKRDWIGFLFALSFFVLCAGMAAALVIGAMNGTVR